MNVIFFLCGCVCVFVEAILILIIKSDVRWKNILSLYIFNVFIYLYTIEGCCERWGRGVRGGEIGFLMFANPLRWLQRWLFYMLLKCNVNRFKSSIPLQEMKITDFDVYLCVIIPSSPQSLSKNITPLKIYYTMYN